MSLSAEDRRIRALRSSRNSVDPWGPLGALSEKERRPGGHLESTLTVFLAGSECPFTCAFCDLWRNTLEGPTPRGALLEQLRRVLSQSRSGGFPSRIKLYNASNFFDPRAVP
ncbi:MAG TPA: radical SAM protein, partial [Thermoanaerobaculia bacterium]